MPSLTDPTVAGIRKTPLVLQGIVLEILRGHFRRNSEQFQFTDDATSSQIIIEPAYSWNAEVVQDRPAVYVKRGAFQYNRLVIDDLQRKDPANAAQGYTMFVDSTLTSMCISKAPAEVERLAEEVSEVLIAFKRRIREDFGFKKFNVLSINEVGILEESHEFYACPVLTHVQFEESWCIVMDALKLQQVITDVHEGITRPLPGQAYGTKDYGENKYDGGGGTC